MEAATASTFGYTTLTADEKKKIHQHIEKIRELVENSDLEDGKKNSLFGQIGRLRSEVDRNGTRSDRFFAFASELGFATGGFAKNARPMFKEVKDILSIVTGARARHDKLELPPGDEILSLPKPKE